MIIVSGENKETELFNLLIEVMAKQDAIIAFLAKKYSKDEAEKNDLNNQFGKIIAANMERIKLELYSEFGSINEGELNKE